MTTMLALDLSTSSTGFAVFDRKTKKPIKHGVIKPKVPGVHKLKYPEAVLAKMKSVASQVRDLVVELAPEIIVCEEVNRGIGRISQKGLDALHFFVLDYVMMVRPDLVKTWQYIDSNGRKGWRGMLGLKLSDTDKEVNANLRLKNRRKKASEKSPLIDWKVLAQRWVNVRFKKTFNVWENDTDADEVDAIALGTAWLEHVDK
jgi:Holliday junction resolvasome RuvABC endonuclease subunit